MSVLSDDIQSGLASDEGGWFYSPRVFVGCTDVRMLTLLSMIFEFIVVKLVVTTNLNQEWPRDTL